MSVDQARHDQVAGRDDDFIRLLRQLDADADLFDHVAADEDRSVGDLTALCIHGDQHAGIAHQQGLAGGGLS